MASDENQRAVFDFFTKYLETRDLFSKQDVERVTSWQGQSFPTYWSKHLSPLAIKVGSDKYRVSEAFRYSTWEKFRQHVTQMRRVAADYEELKFETVRIYEFFMPLTNEAHLRVALDALFYRDSVEARLKTIPSDELEREFPRESSESSEAHVDRLCGWISNKVGGYSIYHVNGRFRAQPLAMPDLRWGRGLKIPCPTRRRGYAIDLPCEDLVEAKWVEFFITNLLSARFQIEVVNGEDDIWMVENRAEESTPHLAGCAVVTARERLTRMGR